MKYEIFDTDPGVDMRVSFHDSLSVATVILPSPVETERVAVEAETRGEVTRGMTRVDRHRTHRGESKEANVEASVSVDSVSFRDLTFERVARGN